MAVGRTGQHPEQAVVVTIELVDQAARMEATESQAVDRERKTAEPFKRADAAQAEPLRQGNAANTPSLAKAQENRAGLKITGDNVVPPRLDARFHNAPPAYPANALRGHVEGDVLLAIRVTAAGLPGLIVVQASSGDPELDRAAKDAVARWRFLPARNAGAAVSFDFKQAIRFRLGGTS